jgi:hypothetical protein
MRDSLLSEDARINRYHSAPPIAKANVMPAPGARKSSILPPCRSEEPKAA